MCACVSMCPPARWATLQSLQTSLSRLSNRPPSISIFAPADPPAPLNLEKVLLRLVPA